ncbi:MAG: Response regulator, partial [uncultured Solirubrobacteraceae bacterium]
ARHRAVRGDLRPLLCPRHHGGPARGPRAALVRDRDAHRRGARAERGRPLGPVLRAAAQGRGLLGDGPADDRAVRGRRAGGQAHGQARRHHERPAAQPLDAALRRPRAVLARAAGAGALPVGPGRRDPAGLRHPLRPRRRDRADALPERADRPGHPQPGRALGRRRGAGRAGRRADPARGADPLPRADRRGLPRRRRRPRGPPRRAPPARALVRPRARRRPRAPLPRPPLLGHAGALRHLRLRAGRPPAHRERRASGPDRRGVRPRRGRQVAVHRPPLRAGRRDRGRDRPSPGLPPRHPARPASRRPPARRGQARGEQPHPRQARPAHRRGVRRGPPAPGPLPRDPRAGAVLRAHRGARGQPPRAPGRPGLPPRPRRRGPRPRHARPRGGRRLRGADRHAPLPRRAAGGRRARDHGPRRPPQPRRVRVRRAAGPRRAGADRGTGAAGPRPGPRASRTDSRPASPRRARAGRL